MSSARERGVSGEVRTEASEIVVQAVLELVQQDVVFAGVVFAEVRNVHRVDQHCAPLPQEIEQRDHLAVDFRVPAEELAHHPEARAGEAVGVESLGVVRGICPPRPPSPDRADRCR